MLKKFIDIKLLKILLLFFVLVEVLFLLKRIFYLYQGNLEVELLEWVIIVIPNYLIDLVSALMIMLFFAYYTKKILIFRSLKLRFLIRIFYSFFLGWLVTLVSSLTLLLIGKLNLESVFINISFFHFMENIVINFLIYFSMIGIIYTYYNIQQIEKIEKQKSNLKSKLTETKMKVLTEKLHPHFLFNTLNTITSLVDVDKNKAKNTIADLSDLLREIIDLKEDHLILLEQELNLLKKYIDIKSIRFYDHLDIHVNVEDNLDNVLIPSMLIQPILENSFKHGYSYNHTYLKINLNIYKENEQLIVEIRNNGEKIKNSLNELQKLGIGIKNTIERLQTIYQDRYQYSMKNLENNNGVITKMCIPYQIGEAKLYKFNTFSH